MQLYTQADAARKHLKKNLKSLKNEVKALPESAKAKWVSKVTKYDDQLKQLSKQIKFEGANVQKAELLGGDSRGEAKGERSTDGVLRQAHGTATNTTATLERTLATINQTQEVGNATAARVVEQTEQIRRVRDKTQKLDEDLGRSKKLISRFMRRLYTDKVILAFTFIVVMTIGGIIAYASINPNQTKFNVPEDATIDPDQVKNDVDTAVNKISGRRLRGFDEGAAEMAGSVAEGFVAYVRRKLQ